jgi:acyl-CoA synthetase (AMP-forming)/AMP-acid ligase II
MTIYGLLRLRAKETPERVFLIFEGREYPYRELDERSNRVAARLVKAGVRPGDHVAVLMGNCPEFLLA